MSESGKSAQKTRLQRRLSSALRENLKRRKAQAKGRGAGEGDPQRPGPAKTHDSAGIGADKQGR
jgi:hypothetical protein